jgi:hypothetical protein
MYRPSLVKTGKSFVFVGHIPMELAYKVELYTEEQLLQAWRGARKYPPLRTFKTEGEAIEAAMAAGCESVSLPGGRIVHFKGAA